MKSTFTVFLIPTLLLAACRADNPEPQDPVGPLEGEWRYLNADHIEYDQQGKIVASYIEDAPDFKELTINANEMKYFNEPPYGLIQKHYYTRVGDQIHSDSLGSYNFSYTIKKLTQNKLELLYIEQPRQSGNKITHYEHLNRLERK